MLCPICTNVNLVMTDRQGVEIDYCPKCRGVWLDRGELDKIIERAALELRPPTQVLPQQPPPQHPAGQPYYRDDDDDDDDRYKYGQKRKKKGLLGELFDF